MSLSLSTATVCFIACHGGPADHFATFAQELDTNVKIFAAGPALKKLQERATEGVSPFFLDNLQPDEEDELADQMARICTKASLVLIDVGHAFDIKIQKALTAHAVPHLAYYDNPEPFVPGGYSRIAAQVMEEADGILFANENLAKETIYSEIGKEVDFGSKKRFGIGYYPVEQAKQIAERREREVGNERSLFFTKNGIKDKGQKIFVYFGGNNEVYFSKAFPAFLSILAESSYKVDLSNLVIVIQQHPGAIKENQDGKQLAAWLENFGENPEVPKIILSDFSSDKAQVIADAAFYYQTSMGPQFVLAGIPVVQIGHDNYEDILVRNDLASRVTCAKQFVNIIEDLDRKDKPQEDLLSKLGIREDWAEVLLKVIKESVASKKTVNLSERRIGKTLPYVLTAGAIILVGCLVMSFFKPHLNI